MSPPCEDTWEIVGGAATGGIIVRTGKDKQSPECKSRLSTGAKIRIVEANATRASYELVSGDGPEKGWVSTQFQGRDLIAKVEVGNDEKVLEEYGRRFGLQPPKDSNGFQRTSFPWAGNQAFSKEPSSQVNNQQLAQQLQNEIGLQPEALEDRAQKAPKPKLSATANQSKLPLPRSQMKGWAQDSDGDDVRICQHCNLPLGDFSYNRGGNCVHGECMAQLMVHDLRAEENARVEIEKASKEKQHTAYSIGWSPEHIPRNDEAARKLAMRDVPQGMVCLVLDEFTGSIRVGATTEPLGSMNLEYLSTALKVRRIEGHEPVFSLDPVDPLDKNTMQEKVFVPEWLAGTTAGEVLFQSDYHLKELSMGQYDQPVVGMKSGFDHTEIDGTYGWNAREWFLVRKAEVQISDMNMLVPMVKMGVEAREQVVNGSCLEDKPVTHSNHPMVKYAADFTHNFDLIAERKSVIFHLRELAKASVMAKFLLDSGAELEESWFNLSEGKEDTCSLQVPQLWNERIHSQVCIQDGSIKQGNSLEVTNGVYGGVHFGLEKFSLAGRQPVSGALSMTTGIPPRLGGGLGQFTLGATSRQPVSALSLATGIARPAPALATSAGLGGGLLAPGLAARQSQLGAGLTAGTTIQSSAGGALRPAPTQKLSFGLSRAAGLTPISSLISASGVAPAAISVPPEFSTSVGGITENAPESLTTGPGITLKHPRLSALPAGVTMMPRAGLSELTAARMQKVDISMAQKAGAGYIPGARALLAPNLQGVDLRLDQFDLSEPKRMSLEVQAGSWGSHVKSLDECVAVGSSFFAALDGSKKVFKEADHALLLKVLHPTLSDRRAEGNLFVPPDASFSYVEHLRALVKEEDILRDCRKEAFFAEDFAMSNPGTLFPHSWTPAVEVASGNDSASEGRSVGSLVARPEYTNQTVLLKHLKKSAPVFDKTMEDGLRFRTYRIGTLEVRTTQEHTSQEEVVGAVFSIQNPQAIASTPDIIDERERLTKLMEYVEQVDVVPGADVKRVNRRYYLVLETEKGNKIVTERMCEGRLSWVFNPADLEDRNSLAKLTRSEICASDVSIRDMLSCRAKLAEDSAVSSKRFVQAMFNRAVGSAGGVRPSNRDFSKGLKA